MIARLDKGVAEMDELHAQLVVEEEKKRDGRDE